jgi:multidrug efflux pump subunit AcrA (membrane-fusion protein)
MNKKKIIVRSILVLLVIFIIYLFVKSPEDTKPSYNAVMKDQDIKNVEFPVKVAKLEYGTLVKNIKSNGTVKAFNEAEIIPQLSGVIIKSNIHEGKFVRSGEVLIELDDREYTLQLSSANNNVMRAQLDYLTLRISDDMTRKLVITDEQVSRINTLSDAYTQAKLLYERGEISQDDYLNARNK